MSNQEATPETPDDWGGPYVLAAFFCENLLEDKDGLITAVRVLDRVAFTGLEWDEAKDTPPALPVRALVMLRGAPEPGVVAVRIVGRSPSGRVVIDQTVEPQVGGAHLGANLLMTLPLAVTEAGVHWYDVRCDGRLMTKFSVFVDHDEAEQMREDGA